MHTTIRDESYSEESVGSASKNNKERTIKSAFLKCSPADCENVGIHAGNQSYMEQPTARPCKHLVGMCQTCQCVNKDVS